MPAPLPHALRQAIADDIRTQALGRNAIARKHRVSPGVVTKIARDERLHFENDWMTRAGSEAHRIDCAAARLDREIKLTDQLLALPQTARRRDGRETKAYRRISYKLYDLERHHA